MNKKKVRNLHSTLGFLYVGLIISFAFSGLMMNHREVWHPEKYTTEIKKNYLTNLPDKNGITDESVEQLIKQLGIDDKVKRHMVRKGELRISCGTNDVDVDLKTGQGEITEFVKTPFISHIMGLHKNSSVWWIYYSDIFAISLIVIAVTGILMIPTQKIQRRRSVILMVGGVLFPILFILLLAS